MGEQGSQELPWEVTALAAIDQPVLVTDGIELLYANAAAREFFGAGYDVAGSRIAEIGLRMLDRAGNELPFESTIATALATGLPAELTGRLVRPDGSERWVHSRFTPVTVGSRHLVVTSARDVTREHAARAERLELERRVEHMERLETLGQLAGGVAHDFNNLLAAISLTTELLHGRLPPGSFEREQTGRLLQMTDRGVSLTNQLLVFARREPQSLSSVDLNAVVRRTDELLARVLGEHVERRLELCDGPALVTGDSRQLEQMIVNLATNSRDAMPSGGILRIQTSLIELDDAGRETYSTADTGTFVQLVVEDDGKGMPADVRAHAFELFFTTKAAGESTGLGLAAVSSIASRSGGGAAVYSEPGVGTVVRVVLPAADDAPVVRDEPAAVPRASDAHGELVVVVEDEDDLRKTARRLLERAGYAVLAYRDGYAALHDAESWPRAPDVLLTDVVLPKQSGPQLALSLREKFPALRVVLMSGYPAGPVAHDPDAAGVILLEKPFRAEPLLVALRQALDAPPG